MRGSVVGEGEISRNPLRCLAGYEIRSSPWMPPTGLWLERIDQLDAAFLRILVRWLVLCALSFPVPFIYHVTSRGDRREATFDDDEDAQGFLAVLGLAGL